jgi:hypothetical protein
LRRRRGAGRHHMGLYPCDGPLRDSVQAAAAALAGGRTADGTGRSRYTVPRSTPKSRGSSGRVTRPTWCPPSSITLSSSFASFRASNMTRLHSHTVTTGEMPHS